MTRTLIYNTSAYGGGAFITAGNSLAQSRSTFTDTRIINAVGPSGGVTMFGNPKLLTRTGQRQGLTIVTLSAQLELTLPLSPHLGLTMPQLKVVVSRRCLS